MPWELHLALGIVKQKLIYWMVTACVCCNFFQLVVHLIIPACFNKELQVPGSLDADYLCRSTMLRENVQDDLIIQNGFVEYTGTSIGSLATYHCKEGYLLAGNSQRTCQSNAYWNGSTPECQHIQNNSS